MARPTKAAPGIGERLLTVRGDRDRKEFADALGVHANSIANYERGDRKVDPDFLAKIREVTGVDVNWLLTGQGAPYEISRFVEIESDVAQRLDMKEQYVRAIFYRLDAMQDEIGVDLHADAIWYALSMINQVMIRDFAGRDVTDEEMEPILAEMVDKQFRQAHGKKKPINP